MEFGTTIIGISILLVCILPFIMVSVNSKRKMKNKLQELIKYAQLNNAKIDAHEIWANSALGIDFDSIELFFISHENNQKIFQKLALSEIESCQIMKISNTFNGKSSSYIVIEKLDLMLTYKDKKKKHVELNIYNMNHQNLTISGELAIAEKWNKIINEKIILISTSSL